MRKVDAAELLDLPSYERIRPRFLARMIATKKRRRVAVGDHMTFVFENRDTVLFQIQEMLRTERITSERGIAHELDTYNSMVPAEHELFATLMIEYDDPDERARMLIALAGLGDHVSMRFAGREAPAEIEALPGEEPDRLPAVNYVRFRVGPDAATVLADAEAPVELVISHPAYQATRALPAETRDELRHDLLEP